MGSSTGGASGGASPTMHITSPCTPIPALTADSSTQRPPADHTTPLHGGGLGSTNPLLPRA